MKYILTLVILIKLVVSSPYLLVNRRADFLGMCLYNASPVGSLGLVSSACVVSAVLTFSFGMITPNTYQIIRNGKNLCIAVTSLTDGSWAALTNCTDDPLQKWEWRDDETIRIKDTNMCLGFAGAETSIGANLQAIIKVCDPALRSQKWTRSFFCPAGMEMNDSFDSCNICPDGYFKNITSNFARCLPCPPGMISTEDYSSCISCPSGRCSWQYNSVQIAGFGSGTSDGPLSSAGFGNPVGIVIGKNNSILVADAQTRKVRLVSDTNVTTFAGSGTNGNNENYGNLARFNSPSRITYDMYKDRYFVSDSTSNLIRVINSTMFVETLSIQNTTLNTPRSVLLLNNYTLLIADSGRHRIAQINLDSNVGSSMAGSGIYGYANGDALNVRLYNPSGICLGRDGNLLIADYTNAVIRQLNMTTMFVTNFGSPGNIQNPSECVYEPIADRFYISNVQDPPLFMQLPNGFMKPILVKGPIVGPWSLTVDRQGHIYIASSGNKRIYKVYACPPFTIWDETAKSCFCMAGYESMENQSTVEFCQKCPVGKYKSLNSTRRGEMCLPCPVGTESSTDGTSCKPCDLGVKYRPFLELTECIECPRNAICTPSNFSCAAGFTLNANETMCVECPSGYFKANSGNGSCALCPMGKEPVNRTSCEWCSSGFFKPLSSMTYCIECPVGAKCTAQNLTCLKGFEPSKNQSLACENCDMRSYKDEDGNFPCKRCPGDSYSSDDFQTCLSCAQGLYKTSNDTCEKCPMGFQPNHNRTSCVECPTGTYKPSGDLGMCLVCPRFSSCTNTGYQCLPGFSLNEAISSCQRCQVGYIKEQLGNHGCTQCGIGTQTNSDNTVCVKCPTDTYRSALSFSFCVPCPLGASCTESSFVCNSGWRRTKDGLGCDNLLNLGNETSGADGENDENGSDVNSKVGSEFGKSPKNNIWSFENLVQSNFYEFPLFYVVVISGIICIVSLGLCIFYIRKYVAIVKQKMALFAGYNPNHKQRQNNLEKAKKKGPLGDSQLMLTLSEQTSYISTEYAEDTVYTQ